MVANPATDGTSTSEDIVGLYLLGPLVAATLRAFQHSLDAKLDLRPPPPLAVILDLRGTTTIDDDGCGALRDVRAKLWAEPTQLHLAATNCVHDRLERNGVVAEMGTDAVHASARSAVLAAYASLPGPGVATPRVRQALREPFDWLELS